jgi:hypothetical protein
VALHIDTVRNSGRQREIRAIKIWSHIRGLEWPSLYLELFTIQALRGRPSTALADNVAHALRTIATMLLSTRIEDPANSNNILSDDLTLQEKGRITAMAAQSAQAQNWGEVIW